MRIADAEPSAQGGKSDSVRTINTDLDPNLEPLVRFVALSPHSVVKSKVRLPRDGRTNRIAMQCFRPMKKPPGWWQSVRRQWLRLRTPMDDSDWAECDQEIQCPLVRPDGTVEPPRLVPKSKQRR